MPALRSTRRSRSNATAHTIVAIIALGTALALDASVAAQHPWSESMLLAITPVKVDVPPTRFVSADLSRSPGALALSIAGDGVANWDDFARGASPSGASGQGAGTAAAPGSGAADTPPPAARSRKFGEQGMVTFNIFGDYANDFEANWLAGVQVGVSWFFVDNLSLDVQLEQYAIVQEGPNAYAIGPAVLMRWHFLPRDTWSLYADLGCGVLYSTEPVPMEASHFNFTPRLGIGGSFAITESARILGGIRWFHMSNANTSTPNPGRDSLELYAGLSLPF